jgi:DNA topoisomerase IB
MSTGIRPTDENDNPKPDKKAFGAITMLGKHVFTSGKKVYVELPAKKGTIYKAIIDNPKVAADLIKRKRSAGNDGRIFDTSGSSVLGYSKKETGYLIKDYRTHIANALASKVIKAMPKPTTEREYNSMRNKVGEVVSAKLCNTKGMALSSYIDPSKFEPWAKGIKFKKKELEEDYILEFEEEIMIKKKAKDWENLSADDFNIDEIMKEDTPVWDNIEDKDIYEELLSELTEAERDAIVNDEPPSDRVLRIFNMTREEFESLQKKVEEE